ncbi:hypothetical protein YQE_06879, partial [Dendroctonus ponderosae]
MLPSFRVRLAFLRPDGVDVEFSLQATSDGGVLLHISAHLGEVDSFVVAKLNLRWQLGEIRTVCVPRGATEPAHCLCAYEQTELISATTANRVGVHTEISFDSSYSSTKLRGDTFKGLLTAMAVLPLNRLLLLGADNGQISLLC